MAAATLLIVGKFFLPIFLKNHIYTMPQFLDRRYGRLLPIIMAIFWLALYVFVNLTSIIWLGSIAVNKVAGIDQNAALVILGAFALLYQIRGGLKAVALTDIVQVTLAGAGRPGRRLSDADARSAAGTSSAGSTSWSRPRPITST